MNSPENPTVGSIESFHKPNPEARYLPLSWSLDPSMAPSRSAEALIIKERQLPVRISVDTSLRPKIVDACGMTCTFCHNEGTPVAAKSHNRVSIFTDYNGVDFTPATMSPDEEFRNIMQRMKLSAGISEVHLTGGEPTLHPQLSDIIGTCKKEGLVVKITSNGENGSRVLEECAKAGLDGIVFSIFGTTAEELAQVQHQKFRTTYLAQRKLDALRTSIDLANSLNVDTAANIVMPDASHNDRVLRVLKEFSPALSLRILNSLDRGDESYFAIYDFLAQLGAEPQETHLTAGSSSARVDYRLPNGRMIKFKQIRPAKFEHICLDCPVDKKGDCEEGFYGLRLYRAQEDLSYRVGFCIQRMDTAMGMDDFFDGEVPELLNRFRQDEIKMITEVFSDKVEVSYG